MTNNFLLLYTVCTQLLVSPDSDDECHHCYVQLLDKCIQHISAFTQEQKRKMASWRLQVTQMIPNNKYNNGLLRRGLVIVSFFYSVM